MSTPMISVKNTVQNYNNSVNFYWSVKHFSPVTIQAQMEQAPIENANLTYYFNTDFCQNDKYKNIKR